jgi:CRP-like cAMP-binding protein
VGQLTLDDSLRSHTFLAGLPSSLIHELAQIAIVVDFDPDAVIIEGQRWSKCCFLLVSGSVAVELATPRFAVCVQVLKPGDMFGWSAFLDHQDTVFRVRARERASTLVLDGQRLTHLCEQHPETGTQLLLRTLRVVAGRVKATENAFAQFCGIKV